MQKLQDQSGEFSNQKSKELRLNRMFYSEKNGIEMNYNEQLASEDDEATEMNKVKRLDMKALN